MRPFRNNQKRIRNRNIQDRSFKRSNDMSRLNSDYGNKENGFRRKNNRNNGNVEKLIAKYNELAREALSNGDKILSENYFQHAEHFIRVLEEKEAHFNKAQSAKVIVKTEEEKDQIKNNTNGKDTDSLKATNSTES